MAEEKFTANLPPLPWSYVTTAKIGKHEGSAGLWLVDANGRKIAAIYGTADEKLAIVELAIDAADTKMLVPA